MLATKYASWQKISSPDVYSKLCQISKHLVKYLINSWKLFSQESLTFWIRFCSYYVHISTHLVTIKEISSTSIYTRYPDIIKNYQHNLRWLFPKFKEESTKHRKTSKSPSSIPSNVCSIIKSIFKNVWKNYSGKHAFTEHYWKNNQQVLSSTKENLLTHT